jgi:hypothetical protein
MSSVDDVLCRRSGNFLLSAYASHQNVRKQKWEILLVFAITLIIHNELHPPYCVDLGIHPHLRLIPSPISKGFLGMSSRLSHSWASRFRSFMSFEIIFIHKLPCPKHGTDNTNEMHHKRLLKLPNWLFNLPSSYVLHLSHLTLQSFPSQMCCIWNHKNSVQLW